jgi:DNA-binding XRE family transcriptional regulator
MHGLRGRRLELGLSQAEVASAAGLSRQLVSAVESGRNVPSVSAALAIAGALTAEVEDLFGPPPVSEWEPVLGDVPPERTLVVAGRVGDRGVYAPLPKGGTSTEGWRRADGILGSQGIEPFDERALNGFFVAGCDPVLPLAAELLPDAGPARLLPVHATSVAAARALHRDRIHAAIVHGTPDRLATPTPRSRSLQVARWRVGLAAPPGDSLDLEAIAAGRVRVAHRPIGAEAEKALGRALARYGGPGRVEGTVASGHIEAAQLASEGRADVALTMEPAANAFDLDFKPLEEHTVELRVDERWMDHPGAMALLELFGSAGLDNRLRAIGGYELIGR